MNNILTNQFVFYRDEWWRVTGYYDKDTLTLANNRTNLLADKTAVVTRRILEEFEEETNPLLNPNN